MKQEMGWSKREEGETRALERDFIKQEENPYSQPPKQTATHKASIQGLLPPPPSHSQSPPPPHCLLVLFLLLILLSQQPIHLHNTYLLLIYTLLPPPSRRRQGGRGGQGPYHVVLFFYPLATRRFGFKPDRTHFIFFCFDPSIPFSPFTSATPLHFTSLLPRFSASSLPPTRRRKMIAYTRPSFPCHPPIDALGTAVHILPFVGSPIHFPFTTRGHG